MFLSVFSSCQSDRQWVAVSASLREANETMDLDLTLLPEKCIRPKGFTHSCEINLPNGPEQVMEEILVLGRELDANERIRVDL